MKIINKHTGYSFNLSPKEAADFFYVKNSRGKYINTSDDYDVIEDKKELMSDFKFYLLCIGVVGLFMGSILLHIHLNY
jgi:hypothetical protein